MRSQRVLMELVDVDDISIKVLVGSPMSMSLVDLASLRFLRSVLSNIQRHTE